MSTYIIQGETLTSIADAIRAKTETEDTMTPSDMSTLINGLDVGGGSNG